MYRRGIALALASVAAAAAHVPPRAGRETAAFAAASSLRKPGHSPAVCSTFVNALVRADTQAEEATADRTQPALTMMASRRNLKKEKRARNEFYARQFRKAPPPRFARGPGGASRAAQENDDGKWLEQIYGQHSIFRTETVAVAQNPAEMEAKPNTQASVASEARTLVAA